MPDVHWRLWNAEQHLHAFSRLTQEFLKSDFYEVGGKEEKKGRLVIRFTRVDPFPSECQLLIGDCAHNLRAALDHIAWLVCNPQTEREEKAVQFPLRSTGKKFREARWHLPGLPRGALTVFESLQPYHRRKWPETAVLGQLQEISNWDKHRMLLASAIDRSNTRLPITVRGPTTLRREVRYRGPVELGAVIARLEMGPSRVGAQVDVDGKFSALEVFDKGCPKEIAGQPIAQTLGDIGGFIAREIAPRFERFVPPPQN
jgi:hypothetical protein